MPTSPPTSDINEVEYGWGELLRPLYDLFSRYGRRRARRNQKSFNAWTDDPRLLQAISAVRMAAHPGEDYEDVSARIDREAARYREFLRNPIPIGKITLNTKIIDADVRVGNGVGDKYQVCDPAGGRAAVFYSVDRSASLVLEFIVHDQGDAPLFPIVRTYSDWLGRKSFDLGAGRTFDLHMSEDECPAKVRVHARVATVGATSKADTEEVCFAEEMSSPPVGAGTNRDRAMARGASGWSYGGRVSLAFGVECLILFVFGWTFLRPAGPLVSATAPAPAAASGIYAAAQGNGGSPLRSESTRFLDMDSETSLMWHPIAFDPASEEFAGVAQRKSDSSRREFKRIAAVSRGRVKMDEGFCRTAGESCDKWRARMQNALDVMSGLLTHRVGGPVAPTSSRPEAVLISYPTAGADAGQMHVTLLLDNAFFLLRGTDCMELAVGAAKGLNDAPFDPGVSDMCKGTESSGQPTEGDIASTPEGGAKSLDAE